MVSVKGAHFAKDILSALARHGVPHADGTIGCRWGERKHREARVLRREVSSSHLDMGGSPLNRRASGGIDR